MFYTFRREGEVDEAVNLCWVTTIERDPASPSDSTRFLIQLPGFRGGRTITVNAPIEKVLARVSRLLKLDLLV